MSKNRVTFYFAYNSPYAFLANTRIDRELATLGVDVDPVPVYRPRAGGGGPDMNSPRMRYIIQDVARFAEAYGLDIDPGPFSDTGRACRGYLFAKDAGGGTDRMVAYARDMDVLRFHIPQELQFLEPQRRADTWVYYGHGVLAGLEVMEPAAFRYRDNI